MARDELTLICARIFQPDSRIGLLDRDRDAHFRVSARVCIDGVKNGAVKLSLPSGWTAVFSVFLCRCLRALPVLTESTTPLRENMIRFSRPTSPTSKRERGGFSWA